MRHEFRLADIGEGLEEAEIVRWLVGIGDRVTRDQPLIEVMTDKSNAELPAPETGTVIEVGGAVGDLIQVGELIAVIETDIDAHPADQPDHAPHPDHAPPVADQPDDAPPVADQPDDAPPAAAAPARPKASPSTRRIAAERNIDLATIRGTGPGGRILLSDLDSRPDPTTAPPQPQPPTVPEPASPDRPTADRRPEPEPATATASQSEPAEPQQIALRGVRRAIARNMTRSWSEIPHIHAFDEIDAEPLLELRDRLRASGKPDYDEVTPLTFFVAAVARALTRHPEANASIDMTEATITRHATVNVGVAVASDQGLVVPVLQHADRLGFSALARTLAELVSGARSGMLAAEHFRGGTVTVTNFGSLGGAQATPLIRPPESAIFGFGAIVERPFVIDGSVVARKTLPTVVGADHRLLDGDVTTAVLHAVGAALLDPLQLVL